MNAAQHKALQASGCEVHVDDLTRQLFATDASVYQIVPQAVAFPRSAEEAAALVRAAGSEDIAVTLRGAGTGLAGGAVGDGLIVDFSRYNRTISKLDLEQGTVHAEAGVVLDQLNAELSPHGYCFGPDVATSSRATLGGMIANNSSGARAPLYGTTADHVVSLDILLAEGTCATVGAAENGLPELSEAVGQLIAPRRVAIEEKFREGFVKRWAGYGFERWVRKGTRLSELLPGSEGTLAGITGAVLRVTPLPKSRSVVAVFFDTVSEALSATVEIQELTPAAIEHIDRVLFDQTIGQLAFKKARALLELDEYPCEAILLVEFYDDEGGCLENLLGRSIGVRKSAFTREDDMAQIWSLRKAGLSLLTGCPGSAKPAAGIEDAAVRPEQLPEYVEALQKIMAGLGLAGSFYGHAASGLLHVRPVVDLHAPEDIAKYRELAGEVSALTKQFNGSIAAEHGVGIARTEFLAEQLGSVLTQLTADVKNLFDPGHVLKPGKIVPDGRFKIDTNLRQGPGSQIDLPFDPILAFAAKDHSFAGNLEQCNGCGGCRKDGPTMCPTFRATGQEIMSTRGRANTIRAALEGRLGAGGPLDPPGLYEALESCLSCKACTTECPSNVNLALLKAELLHARHGQRGLPLSCRVLSQVDWLGRWGTRLPRLTNGALKSRMLRRALQGLLGLAVRRPLPPYASERFDHWFHRRTEPLAGTPRVASPSAGPVILWDDCFVRYNEPRIGVAAVRVLEAAGHEVTLPEGRVCCGRPAFSMGRLDEARDLAKRNARVMAEGADVPIVFLEPSCHSMFAEDYRELGIAGAEALARRSVLFEDFIAVRLEEKPDCLNLERGEAPVAIHRHCHADALSVERLTGPLAGRFPGGPIEVLASGCCGMAGAFGAMEKTYDLSLSVAEPLMALLETLPPHTAVIASGTSCRHQIEHLGGTPPLHMAEYLANALAVEAEDTSTSR